MLLVLRVLLVLGLALLLHATRKTHRVSTKSRQGISVRLVLDPSVRPGYTSKTASNVANMSLSPWTYKDSFVASRVPQRISHAQCLTTSCLTLQEGRRDAALEAKPIYYQVLVLHRVPRQKRNNKGGRNTRKKYEFRLGTEMISVGCTCVRPTVIPQQ